MLAGYNRKDFIIEMVQNLFIDPKTGECEFDRAEFEKILKISERFPIEGPEGDGGLDFQKGLKDGDPVINRAYVRNFRSIRTDETFYFGEDIMYKGYPGPAENGSYFVPCAKFAIAEKSDDKEGAFKFLKYVLDNHKDEYDLYLPVKLSMLETDREESMSDPYFLTPLGEKEEYDYILSMYDNMGGVAVGVFVGNNSEEDADKVMSLILSAEYVRRRDDRVSGILSEEIDAFLSGNKSAEEAVDVIENRINLYISESGE
jgi:hypothetical protein